MHGLTHRTSKTGGMLAVAVAAMIFAGAPVQGQITVFTAALAGSNEVPPAGSPGMGFGTVTLDQTLNTLLVNESFAGLTTTATAAHLHCCSPPGVNAVVAVPFLGFPSTTSGPFTHLYDLTDATIFNGAFLTAHGGTAALARADLITGLFGGRTYLNIHTATFPGGEIRGQLVATPEPASLVLLGTGLILLVGLARKTRG